VEGAGGPSPNTSAQMTPERPLPDLRQDGVSTPISQHSETSAQLTMEERVERMLNNLEAANSKSPFNAS